VILNVRPRKSWYVTTGVSNNLMNRVLDRSENELIINRFRRFICVYIASNCASDAWKSLAYASPLNRYKNATLWHDPPGICCPFALQ
jgi:hypothetical protein